MTLLAVYILILGALVAVSYFIGLAVETMWGSGSSLVVFLALFFGSIYVAWQIAVRVTASGTVAER